MKIALVYTVTYYRLQGEVKNSFFERKLIQVKSHGAIGLVFYTRLKDISLSIFELTSSNSKLVCNLLCVTSNINDNDNDNINLSEVSVLLI